LRYNVASVFPGFKQRAKSSETPDFTGRNAHRRIFGNKRKQPEIWAIAGMKAGMTDPPVQAPVFEMETIGNWGQCGYANAALMFRFN
jgi:hypothetical protein